MNDRHICNLCGNPCEVRLAEGARATTGLTGARGAIDVSVEGGPDSAIPGDLVAWNFNLCEPCLGWLVSMFVVPPRAVDTLSKRPEPRLGVVYRMLRGETPDPTEVQGWEWAAVRAIWTRREQLAGRDPDARARLFALSRSLPLRCLADLSAERIAALRELAQGRDPFTRLDRGTDGDGVTLLWPDGSEWNPMQDDTPTEVLSMALWGLTYAAEEALQHLRSASDQEAARRDRSFCDGASVGYHE